MSQAFRDSARLAEVSACLTRLGVAHTSTARWCDRMERFVELAVDAATSPIAVEVANSYRFLLDGPPDGNFALRNRLLSGHGWRVAVVERQVMAKFATDAERDTYIKRVLRRAA